MKWLKRIGIGVLFLIGLVWVYLVGINIYEANFGKKSTALTNLTYTGKDGTELHGYLAEPDSPGPHPGILLIHEWWGLNEGIIVLADALAAEVSVIRSLCLYHHKLPHHAGVFMF